MASGAHGGLVHRAVVAGKRKPVELDTNSVGGPYSGSITGTPRAMAASMPSPKPSDLEEW
eukprot:CAMPEP_0177790004 /NCGR_PEP_ID=MMETSP0491_2-20121128/23092_1 /TAXON_ID=63592 /ORGANISM="Tetraselmis chuii, Strain PLY429" /LENGTH=59 /DNA_ID=CAMNT_0019311987 /DNA_START=158 /DNA_END=334 /DNA_ORIENTATION=-